MNINRFFHSHIRYADTLSSAEVQLLAEFIEKPLPVIKGTFSNLFISHLQQITRQTSDSVLLTNDFSFIPENTTQIYGILPAHPIKRTIIINFLKKRGFTVQFTKSPDIPYSFTGRRLWFIKKLRKLCLFSRSVIHAVHKNL